ncbi:flavin monoamine oxidase family protein [Paracoccus rhizosphaerae]|uniref:Flavin monoamine oxidase family protein n=1 Tax=Paracoccus rhizosphaerae TaxID=1133347 RepID=A0ABV6CGA8_9RHOB|nr:FAD-dependent oxidoreductase [Paracoccus rhizosphaerae]
MKQTTVAIVGGGLAGLNAARLLQQAGLDFELFEARDRLGGRILTVDATGAPGPGGFDLGPSWFWPRMQPAIAALVEELRLQTFAQSSDGDVVFERMSREPAQRYSGTAQEPQSLRLVGGSAALVRALADTVPAERVHLSAPVKHLTLDSGRVYLVVSCADGSSDTVTAEHVLMAVPPRVALSVIGFTPQLPTATAVLWRNTPTWMAPHAKFFALYDRPFWRDAGYSGSVQSMVGPMPEIHDATTAYGQAALFGFLGVGAAERLRMGQEALGRACISQFARIFGAEAARPTAILYKDWADDPWTAAPEDLVSTGHASFTPEWVEGPWKERLLLAGSEVSRTEAGYLAGAVEASADAVAALLTRLED